MFGDFLLEKLWISLFGMFDAFLAVTGKIDLTMDGSRGEG